MDDVSFEVRHGETYGLLGPNGAGKTTTMRLVSGLSPLSAGELIVAGIDVSRQGREVRNVLGVVTQEDGLDGDLSARDNLITYGFIAGLSRAQAAQRADAVLMYFDLTDRSDDEIDNLSGGMKRRLAIARAFMTRPQVIVLDEPTTGLDPQGRNRVWQELETMKQAGVTILMSTHYMDEASALCDRLAIMHHGEILAEGTPRRAGEPARRTGSGAGAGVERGARRRHGLDRELRSRLQGGRRGDHGYVPQRRPSGPVRPRGRAGVLPAFQPRGRIPVRGGQEADGRVMADRAQHVLRRHQAAEHCRDMVPPCPGAEAHLARLDNVVLRRAVRGPDGPRNRHRDTRR